MLDIPDKKVCNKCDVELDLSCFGRRARSVDGYSNICKKCLVLYDKTVVRDTEAQKAKMREWYINNPDKRKKIRERASEKKRLLTANKKAFETILQDTIPAGFKKCFCCKNVIEVVNFHKYHKSKDGLGSYCIDCYSKKSKGYYKTDEESKSKRRIAEKKRYYKLKAEDPEKLKLKYITVALRRRERYAMNGDKVHISIDLLRKVLERDENKCLACGSIENLEMDHIVPVSCGGRTTFDNLQLLCRECNRSKFTKTIDYRKSVNA